MTQRESIFCEHGLPGMTLKALRPPLAPLIKRCACRRPISNNKARCMSCQQEVLQELASQIGTQDLLDAVLRRSFPESRAETLRELTPYLSFTPSPLAAESKENQHGK